MIVDLKGSEQVLLHVEKDLTTKVEHNTFALGRAPTGPPLRTTTAPSM